MSYPVVDVVMAGLGPPGPGGGVAGGDLEGPFSALQIKDGVVTEEKLAFPITTQTELDALAATKQDVIVPGTLVEVPPDLPTPAAVDLRTFGVAVEWFGVVGNGVTDDTVNLRLAVASGFNLIGRKGATYLVSGDLTLLPGQKFDLGGAIVKRAAQVSSTTSTVVSSGVVNYVLADASTFRVGMTVTFAETATVQVDLNANTTLSTNVIRITAINGNTITVSAVPNLSSDGPYTVYNTFNTFNLTDDCWVGGGIVNGNKAQNPWARWEVTGEVHMTNATDRAVVDRLHIFDAPGEGVQLRGNNSVMRHCWVININGNGCHLASTTGGHVHNNYFISNNLDSNIGHYTGSVCFSAVITKTTITENYSYGGRCGIGGLGDNENDGNTLSLNTIVAAVYTGIEVVGAVSDANISANSLYDCGGGTASEYGGMIISNVGGTGVKATGNLFVNSPVKIIGTSTTFTENTLKAGSTLRLNNLNGSKIDDNLLVGSRFLPTTVSEGTMDGNVIDFRGDAAVIAVECATLGEGASFSRNTVLGGRWGLVATSAAPDFTVRGNRFRGQSQNPIGIGSSIATSSATVANNDVVCTLAGSNWVGIDVIGLNVTLMNNHVVKLAGTATRGIRVRQKALLVGNVVEVKQASAAFSTGPIVVDATSTGSTITGNVTPVAIVNNGVDTVLNSNTTHTW